MERRISFFLSVVYYQVVTLLPPLSPLPPLLSSLRFPSSLRSSSKPHLPQVVKGHNLKTGQPLMGIFERNVQLAMHSIPFYVVSIMFSAEPFANWNFYGVMLAALGGGGG